MAQGSRPVRLLLVEDEGIIALAQKKELERFGYEVEIASHAQEAITKATTLDPLDLILMDIDLGQEKDGTVVAKEILAKREIPVVFLSSHVEPEVVEKTEAITSYGYVVKSSGIMVLHTSIKMALRLVESRQRERERAKELEVITERLQINEDRLSKTMIAVNDGIWDWNLLTNEVYYSPRYYTMSGYEVDEFPHRPEEFFSRVHPDDTQRVQQEVEKHLRGETERFVLEFRFRRKDNSWQWILARGYIVERDEGGKPIRFLGTHTDISDRKRAEQALLESKNRYEAIVSQSFDGIGLFSSDGKVVEWNNKMAEITGIAREEALGKYIWEVMVQVVPEEMKSPSLYHQLKDGFMQLVYGHETGWEGNLREQKIARLDGVIRFVQTLSFRVQSGEESLLCTIMRDITEKKQAEEKVVESEERFRNLAESTPIAILIYQHDKWIYTNRAAEVISGYSREEILQMNFWDMVHPEDKRKVQEIGRRRQQGDSTFRTYEVRIVRKDGAIHWVLVYGIGLLVGGKPAGLLSVMDITDRKLVEKRLHEALEEREALLAALPDLLFILDGEGRILDFRASEKTALYTSPENFLGKKVTEVLPPEIASQSMQAIQHALEKGEVSLFSYSLFLGGKNRFFEARHSRIDERRVLGVVRDITDRKEMEERLKESEETYRNLFQNSPVGLFRSRISDGLILECNDQLAKLFGYEKREDVVGKLVSSQNYVDISVRQRMLEIIQKTGEVKNYEVLYRKKDGTTFWARYSARLYPEKGWIEGVFEDVTEEKRAEEELRRQIQEKELILREAHHRIKNNITSIMSLLRIQEDAVTNPEAKSILQDAISRVESMRVMYDKLLLVPDSSSLSVKPYLEELLEAILSIFPDRGKIALSVAIEDFPLDVKRLFPLGIIVNELITNAAKYAFQGRERGSIEVRLEKKEGMVTLSIQDDGVGFSMEKKEKGFGLQLIEMLAAQLGGKCAFFSEGGTKAVVSFPYAEDGC